MRKASSSSLAPDSTEPGLSSWTTSIWLPAWAADRMEPARNDASIGSMRPFTSMTSTGAGPGPCRAAAPGAPPLDYDDRILNLAGVDGQTGGVIRARALSPDTALLEYLDSHGLRKISRRLTRSGTVDVVATAAPGIKDIVLLGKVKQLEQQGGADLIILDAPAAGHAVTLLLSANTLLD